MRAAKPILPIAALAIAGFIHAADPLPPVPAMLPPPLPAMTVPTTVADLATGYAAAVQQMSLKGLVIYCQGDKGVNAIRGIRSVRAIAGVLLITFSAGDMLALSAERIILITDGSRTP